LNKPASQKDEAAVPNDKKTTATANIIFPEGIEGESRIVLSNLHVVFEKGTCQQKFDPMNCVFYPKSGFDEGSEPITVVVA
jgi:hypothetical protein